MSRAGLALSRDLGEVTKGARGEPDGPAVASLARARLPRRDHREHRVPRHPGVVPGRLDRRRVLGAEHLQHRLRGRSRRGGRLADLLGRCGVRPGASLVFTSRRRCARRRPRWPPGRRPGSCRPGPGDGAGVTRPRGGGVPWDGGPRHGALGGQGRLAPASARRSAAPRRARGWRLAFLVNLPMGIGPVLVSRGGARGEPHARPPHRPRPVRRAVLLAVALAC